MRRRGKLRFPALLTRQATILALISSGTLRNSWMPVSRMYFLWVWQVIQSSYISIWISRSACRMNVAFATIAEAALESAQADSYVDCIKLTEDWLAGDSQ